MKINVTLPFDNIENPQEFLPPEAVTQVGSARWSGSGFDGGNVTDHPCPSGRWLDCGGHHAQDPFVMLSFLAAATRKFRLQTGILVLPYRNPFITARAVATLDVFSGGRVTLGLGAGYLKGEYYALGRRFRAPQRYHGRIHQRHEGRLGAASNFPSRARATRHAAPAFCRRRAEAASAAADRRQLAPRHSPRSGIGRCLVSLLYGRAGLGDLAHRGDDRARAISPKASAICANIAQTCRPGTSARDHPQQHHLDRRKTECRGADRQDWPLSRPRRHRRSACISKVRRAPNGASTLSALVRTCSRSFPRPEGS